MYYFLIQLKSRDMQLGPGNKNKGADLQTLDFKINFN